MRSSPTSSERVSGIERVLLSMDWLLDKLTVTLLLLLNLVVGLQVFSRYVLNHSLSWSEELARYMFIWLVFTSAAIVLRKDRHIQVTAFVDKLPVRVRQAIIFLGDCLMLAFAGLVLFEGLRLAAMVWTVLTAAMEIPWTLVYIGIILGMAAMVLALLGSLWARLTGTRQEKRAW
jgi:TRAP-type C4-dicarboxylate transport system permease small subunit